MYLRSSLIEKVSVERVGGIYSRGTITRVWCLFKEIQSVDNIFSSVSLLIGNERLKMMMKLRCNYFCFVCVKWWLNVLPILFVKLKFQRFCVRPPMKPLQVGRNIIITIVIMMIIFIYCKFFPNFYCRVYQE